MAKSNTDHRAVPTFRGELKESFWGDLHGEVQLAAQEVFRGLERAAARPVPGESGATGGRRQRKDYRNGFYQRDFVTQLRDAAVAHCAQSQARVFAGGDGEVSTAGGGGDAADPGSVSARGLDPAGGAGGGHPDRRSGERADGVEAEPASGPPGAPFHQAPLEDEWAYLFLDGVSLRVRRPSGRKRVQMLVAYGVKQRWPSAIAGLSAQPGREPSRLGRFSQPPLRARPAGQASAADRHRRLPRTGGGDSDGLPAGEASALLGAQNAQYPGEGAEARL